MLVFYALTCSFAGPKSEAYGTIGCGGEMQTVSLKTLSWGSIILCFCSKAAFTPCEFNPLRTVVTPVIFLHSLILGNQKGP